MKKQAFTIMEIVIVIVAVGILATIAIPAYQYNVDSAKARVCQTNLEALQTALDCYAMEEDKIPATLSELPWEYIQKAYVKILQRKDAWKVKLAFFILEWQKKDYAYAQSFLNQLAKGHIDLITCPADTTPPEQGGISYGLNSILKGKSPEEYRALPDDTVLIGDCENNEFTINTDLSERHREGFDNYAQDVDKDAEVFKCKRGTCLGNGKGKGLKRRGNNRDREKDKDNRDRDH